MDPFNTIPAELRLQIFLYLQSKTTISSLIQASPIMLVQYLGYKSTIVRTLLESDFDDQMIQDAMGIILFPSLREARSSVTLVYAHLRSWKAFKLPNPLDTREAFLIDQLDKLHSLLMVFVEDYVTKATAAFPPREYVCLPQPTHSQSHLVFKGQKVSKRFDSSNLSGGERRRLLRAFLRVELLSLVQKAMGFKGEDIIKTLFMSPLTSRLEGRDQEAIRCVSVYTSSLYGAIFAHCADAWLPEADAPPETGLLFPDNLFVDPIQYARDVGIKTTEEWSAIDSMAQYGFSLILRIIRFAIARPQDSKALEIFVKKVCSFRMDRSSDTEDLFGRRLPVRGYHTPDHSIRYSTTASGQGFDDQRWWKSLGKRLSHFYGQAIQNKIFQQRAWPFFDDHRHYPEDTAVLPVFPTKYILEGMEEERTGELMSFFESGPVSNAQLESRMEFRRAQKWQDKMKQRQGIVSSTESSLPRVSIGNHEVSLPAIEDQEQLLTWSSGGVVYWEVSEEAYVLVKE
ncbi:hypothetical protein LB505_013340 [Fusarium chuoi]|nr:hypothetical protein LB505_013340 [Fusarium chuoi]